MAEMQKQGRPTDAKADEWDKDLHPHSAVDETQVEKNAPNASEQKELYGYLEGYTDDELKQIPVLSVGTRLKQGATYIDLADPERKEFKAMGGMEVGADNKYVPKTEVDYQLWNRLTGVQDVNRTGKTE